MRPPPIPFFLSFFVSERRGRPLPGDETTAADVAGKRGMMREVEIKGGKAPLADCRCGRKCTKTKVELEGGAVELPRDAERLPPHSREAQEEGWKFKTPAVAKNSMPHFGWRHVFKIGDISF